MRILFSFATLLLLSLQLTSCGDSSKQSPAGTSMKAVIKPTALTADKNIAGINLTISLPVGISPPLNADGSVNIGASFELSSPATPDPTPTGSSGTANFKQLNAAVSEILPGVGYTPASSAYPGQLVISLIKASGFKADDEITIHLKVAAGTMPQPGDFKLLFFEAYDIYGAAVTDLNPTLTTNIQ